MPQTNNMWWKILIFEQLPLHIGLNLNIAGNAIFLHQASFNFGPSNLVQCSLFEQSALLTQHKVHSKNALFVKSSFFMFKLLF